MIATILYISTVIFFGYTIYRYRLCNEKVKVTSCFDEGAEEYLGIIKSEEYEFH